MWFGVSREQSHLGPRGGEEGEGSVRRVLVRDGDLMLIVWCHFSGDMRDLWLNSCYQSYAGRWQEIRHGGQCFTAKRGGRSWWGQLQRPVYLERTKGQGHTVAKGARGGQLKGCQCWVGLVPEGARTVAPRGSLLDTRAAWAREPGDRDSAWAGPGHGLYSGKPSLVATCRLH